MKELLKRLGLNGNTIGFHPQTQKLQLDSVLVSIIDSCRTELLILSFSVAATSVQYPVNRVSFHLPR